MYREVGVPPLGGRPRLLIGQVLVPQLVGVLPWLPGVRASEHAQDALP